MTMDEEGLIRQLQGLKQGGVTLRTYAEIELMFPPGIEDDNVKRKLVQLASDCDCTINNQPGYQNVKFTKR